jgi:2,3-dihydroxybenzoate-AMP ligase
VTHTAVVPAVAGRWLEHAATVGPPESLRVLQVGGARLAEALARKIRPVLGAQLQQVFGMAEGLLNYTRLDDPEDIVCGTQGRPLSPDDEVKVVNDRDRPVKDGQVGVLLGRGPYTVRGYFHAPEQNAKAFTRLLPHGRRLPAHPGGLHRRRGPGQGHDQPRRGEDLRRGGREPRVPGSRRKPGRRRRHARRGARRAHLRVRRAAPRIRGDAAGVARFKLPEHLVVVDELLTTKVGKIDKKALREDLARRLAAEEPT